MKLFRRFLPFLFATTSLGSGFFEIKLIRQLNTSNQHLKTNFLDLFKQPVCKMSTNIKEEVDRQKEFYDSMSLDEKR